MNISYPGDLVWQGHLHRIAEAILNGTIVPFLGADINLCDRPKTVDGHYVPWTLEAEFPPSNHELAAYLDQQSAGLGPAYRQELSCPFMEIHGLEQLPTGCPLRQESAILRLPVQNVSQYVSCSEDGNIALNEALRCLFARDYAANTLHRFLASLPALLRARGDDINYPLIVTTCFDNALEKAFAQAQEPVDIVSFIGNSNQGCFEHILPGGKHNKIEEPNTYMQTNLKKQPTILKLYGGYNSTSYLITEDQYIDYLAHRGMEALIPAPLLSRLRDTSTTLWFIGYSPSLWNQRVILRRLWQDRLSISGKPWWAIQGHPDPLDLRIWKSYFIKTPKASNLSLEEYIAKVDQQLHATLNSLLPKCEPYPVGSTLSNSLPINGTSLDDSAHAKRTGIFISYSHHDKKWLDIIRLDLAPAARDKKISVWDDTKIQPGAKWKEEIEAALATAKVAVLLVSKEFLNSKFIAETELPALLNAAEKEGLKICWILIQSCNYELTKLWNYQAVNDPKRPLEALLASKRSDELKNISKKIISFLSPEEIRP